MGKKKKKKPHTEISTTGKERQRVGPYYRPYGHERDNERLRTTLCQEIKTKWTNILNNTIYQKLTENGTENLNSPIAIIKVEFETGNISRKTTSGPDGFSTK